MENLFARALSTWGGVIALLALSAVGSAQTLNLSGPATARPGSTVTVSVNLAGTPDAAGLQWTFSDAGAKGKPGAAADTAGKALYVGPTGIALVIGMNLTAIQPGEVAKYDVTLPKDQKSATLSLSKMLGAKADGTAIALTAGAPLVIALLHPEDLNGDGKIDSIDLQSAVFQIQGVTPCGSADLNKDGKCDLVDAMTLVKAGIAQQP
jgi:Dockerin type I domain